ncbi:hypothetical protein AVEN_97732-1 [Araneus ventricosus]|uniref:Uncharacterized protein n=1 Tax=Araneus ventricosus TaxID=182803 RepID=A0A4Y2E3Q8_ARAVE|nr:hypothetical protein AVEN_97732-1 [Araneus ventricosus]
MFPIGPRSCFSLVFHTTPTGGPPVQVTPERIVAKSIHGPVDLQLKHCSRSKGHRQKLSSSWCGVEVWSVGCQFRCRPRHRTEVLNYEFRPKIPPLCC